eukprot:Sspe_Gene.61133::Locus_33845_Transcript_2_2_Confidence_0.400_Length_1545::g.61133::m.61133/K08827/PRPF4B; serine/threonine-protein kinase PRP4
MAEKQDGGLYGGREGTKRSPEPSPEPSKKPRVEQPSFPAPAPTSFWGSLFASKPLAPPPAKEKTPSASPEPGCSPSASPASSLRKMGGGGDMFADDDDDIPDGPETFEGDEGEGPPDDLAKHCNEEGFFMPKNNGEGVALESGRYSLRGMLGSGVYGSVWKAVDTEKGCVVAVKVLRSEAKGRKFYECGLREVKHHRQLSAMDPRNLSNCVQLLRDFEDSGHLCIVMELMSTNLRQVFKDRKQSMSKISLPLPTIQAVTSKVISALLHMKRAGLLHADVKPDNILVNEAMTVVRLSDFGSSLRESTANMEGETTMTQYLVPRYYRAPEIICGAKISYGIDMWALCCTVFEMFAGTTLFKGANSSQILAKQIQLSGTDGLPAYLVRGKNASQLFSTGKTHVMVRPESPPDAKAEPVSLASLQKGQKTIDKKVNAAIHQGGIKVPGSQRAALGEMCKFLTVGLRLDPTQRMPIEEAAKHRFITASIPSK